jgi:hypothetical protein
MPDVPYQNQSQVEQALAERENAEIYGQKTLIDAADKVLASFGITTKADREAAGKRRRESLEAAAEAAQERADEARKTEPVDRSTAKKSTAKKK